MKLELPDIPAIERTLLVESLLALLRIQQDRIQQLEATVQQLRDELALLKGQKPRPDIQPSLLEAQLLGTRFPTLSCMKLELPDTPPLA
jgi:hypothetical protein